MDSSFGWGRVVAIAFAVVQIVQALAIADGKHPMVAASRSSIGPQVAMWAEDFVGTFVWVLVCTVRRPVTASLITAMMVAAMLGLLAIIRGIRAGQPHSLKGSPD
jgi:hypothetical protein